MHFTKPPSGFDTQRDMLLHKSIIVWNWRDAPEFLKAFSKNGGDEDWLVLLPPHLSGVWIGWLESDSFDACGEPQVIPLKRHYWVPAGDNDEIGNTIYIGSHA